MKPGQIKRLFTEFGSEIALSSVCASSFKVTSLWKHRCIQRYLKKTYSGLILRYQQEKAETNHAVSEMHGTSGPCGGRGQTTFRIPEVFSPQNISP